MSAENRAPGAQPSRLAPRLLLAMVLVIATAGLVYELTIAAIASYLLGDSVRQFSLIIGVYLSALGLGAYLSRFVTRDLATVFVHVELSAALVGGFSGPVLFIAFAGVTSFQLVLFSLVVVVGTLVGLELPLLIRILERHVRFRDLIAQSLTFDYVGALVGSLGFTLVLVPRLGLVASSLVCGLLNASVAAASTWVLPALTLEPPRQFRSSRIRSVWVLLALALALAYEDVLLNWSEAHLYPNPIEYREQSEYQRIVVTHKGPHFELFLNGNLQFSSTDEARYHEALVHPTLASVRPRSEPLRVLIGGGGDGLAAREVLRWPVAHVTLVDLDPAMTRLGKEHPRLCELNQRSLSDPRVEIVNQDALVFLETRTERYDVMLFDFPDPSSYSLGKLYSKRFFRAAKQRLSPGGAMGIQASSPLYARRSFWCVVTTMESAGWFSHPYHVLVPSFGEWGFVLGTTEPSSPPSALPPLPLQFLSDDRLPALFTFDDEMSRVAVEPNLLNSQKLVLYYNDEWSRWNE